MQYAVIVSEQCPAGQNIKECLLRLFEFKAEGEFDSNAVYSFRNIKIYTIKQMHIYAEDLKIDADYLIFATTHRSEKGVHSLSCHAPGNWGKAELGGKDRKLCVAPSVLLKKAYLTMLKYKEDVPDHDITLEVTHHGPFTSKPTMFIEIGSTDEHWGNKKAGDVIAKTIVEITKQKLEDQQIAFGIGGPHYANSFNKILQRTDIAVGHICPKYNLENLNEGMIKQAIEKTEEKVDFILLDYKGLGKEKRRIKELLNKLNLDFKRTDKL